MCTIHDHARQNGLHSALPSGICNSCLQLFHGHRNPVFQHFHSCKRQRCVHHLIPCNKRNMEPGIPIIIVLQGKINAVFIISQYLCSSLNYFISRTSKLLCLRSDHFCRILVISIIDYRNSRNNDSSLLPCNLSYRISQKLHMIQTDRCNHASYRILYRCSRIQPSAKPGFQSHIVHPCLCKDHHSHKKQHLKISRMVTTFSHKLVRQHFHSLKSFQKGVIINIHLIDLKPLVDLHQMGRRKQTAGIPCLPENRCEKRTGTPLPIRSRNMYHLKLLLWISQSPQAFLCMLQAVLFCKLRSLLNISNRFLIIHNLNHHLSIVFHP